MKSLIPNAKCQILVGIIIFLLPTGVLAAGWTDRSAEIPTSTLDEYVEAPYLSIATGRGTDWLAGNNNQLFLVLKDKTIDLTPDLKAQGFQSVRQVGTDGQGWLIIGDSSPWHSQPDLAFAYDGRYLKNYSQILGAIEPDEWIGKVSGRNGMWLIPTSKRVYLWNAALEKPAKIELPQMMQGGDPAEAYPVGEGWILTYLADGGTSRRYVYFDGLAMDDVTKLMGKLNATITAGTNGGEMLAMCVQTDKRGKSYIAAMKTDGKRAWEVSYGLRGLNMPTLAVQQYPLVTDGRIDWNGKAWIITDADKHVARYDNRNTSKRLQDTKDIFLDASYGKSGQTLLVGYNYEEGKIVKRMAVFTED